MARENPLRAIVGATGNGQHSAPAPPVSDASSLFFKKASLLAERLTNAVVEDGPIVAGPGRELWRYVDGVWLPDGDDEVRRRTKVYLRERWREGHAKVVIDMLACEHPFISDEQPTNWINCRNGLLDWSSENLGPHTPEVPSTYQLSVPWNPRATCPTIDSWLAQVAPDDAIELIWEVIGVSIYPDMPFHRAVLLLGPGRNGKGTLLRLIKALVGEAHVASVTLQSLAENRFATADLFGKVANISGDLDARVLERTDQFKMTTGGDVIRGERKFGHPFNFRNRATMLFAANELPGSKDLSDGFFSRWVIVPFDRLRLAPGEEDPSIEQRMLTELPGMLVKAIAGLRRLMARGGFAMPESVSTATTAYRDNADPVRRFAEEHLTITGNLQERTPRAHVYTTYTKWCEDNGNRPLSAAKLYGHLAAAFPTLNANFMSMGVRYIAGAYLRTNDVF